MGPLFNKQSIFKLIIESKDGVKSLFNFENSYDKMGFRGIDEIFGKNFSAIKARTGLVSGLKTLAPILGSLK